MVHFLPVISPTRNQDGREHQRHSADEGGYAMLVQDNLGQVHQVPDSQFGQVVYDGFGNPVGQLSGPFDFLNPLNAINPLNALNPLNLIQQGVRAVGGLLSPSAPPPQAPLPGGAFPFPSPQMNVAPQFSPPFFPGHVPGRHCVPPVGWTTPALPYTGPQPRRLYMRCSVWPGQSGLVPTAPGTRPTPLPPPGMPGAPGFPGGFIPRHRGRRHHRR
jgi:hypothetical protein